eukprot:gene21421-24298_t
MNAFLYLLTVLIWGTTWIAIKFQLGVVPAPVSIAYRFWIAAAVLLLVLFAMRKKVWPPRAAWPYLAAQGVALFCCNFLCFYYASQWVPSGLVAVVFSTAPIWNALNGRLFLGRALRPQRQAFDRCKVAVVTNMGSGDHLGLNYITTLEDLSVVKRVIVLNVEQSGMAVLNAADPAVVSMALHCPGDVTFFALDGNQPVLAAHRAQGKRVVFTEDGDLVAQNGKQIFRIPLAQVPITRQGQIGFQTENVLAAVAAAWAVNVPWDAIAQGLATFISDIQGVPGRFNVFDYKGATLIADYGHNPDAIQALVQAVDNMPAQKRVVVISGAGDRRDQDIREQTQILGAAFDDVLLYQDACQRGRADGEVIQLLREGLHGAARTRHIEDIQGEFNAIDIALSRLNAG